MPRKGTLFSPSCYHYFYIFLSSFLSSHHFHHSYSIIPIIRTPSFPSFVLHHSHHSYSIIPIIVQLHHFHHLYFIILTPHIFHTPIFVPPYRSFAVTTNISSFKGELLRPYVIVQIILNHSRVYLPT